MYQETYKCSRVSRGHQGAGLSYSQALECGMCKETGQRDLGFFSLKKRRLRALIATLSFLMGVTTEAEMVSSDRHTH